jgi:hypothetical protein
VKSERWRGGVCAFAGVENGQRESVGQVSPENKMEGRVLSAGKRSSTENKGKCVMGGEWEWEWAGRGTSSCWIGSAHDDAGSLSASVAGITQQTQSAHAHAQAHAQAHAHTHAHARRPTPTYTHSHALVPLLALRHPRDV